jgi:hypothetical protein
VIDTLAWYEDNGIRYTGYWETFRLSSIQTKVANSLSGPIFQGPPVAKEVYTSSTRATTPFRGFSPILTRESSLKRPIIATRLMSKRYSCSTNSAITLEELLIPCECLIAPFYVDLGCTTWSYRGL